MSETSDMTDAERERLERWRRAVAGCVESLGIILAEMETNPALFARHGPVTWFLLSVEDARTRLKSISRGCMRTATKPEEVNSGG